MSDELERIDTSPIQSLSGLRRERAVLEERLAKMEEMREKVSPEVFERVRGDYENRRDQLDSEARPLEAAARREWVKLRQLHGECDDALRQAELEREEIDFRFALGELDEESHVARIADADRVVGSRRERLEAVGEVRAAFLAVFDSEAALEAASADQEDDEAEAQPSPAQPGLTEADGPDSAAGEEQEPDPATSTMITETSDAAPSAATDEASDDDVDDDEPTDVHAVRPDLIPPPVPAAAEAKPAPAFAGMVTAIGPNTEDAGEMTVIIRRARLIRLDENGDPEQELMLGSDRVSIGRGSENTIRLDTEAVSRQHAVIDSRLGSYIIYDLHSENGTMVNEEAITERPLTDGDRIRVGTCELIFRAR